MDGLLIAMILIRRIYKMDIELLNTEAFLSFSWAYYFVLGILGSFIFYLIIKDIFFVTYKIISLARSSGEIQPVDPARRDFFKSVGLATFTGTSVLTSIAGLPAAVEPKLLEVDVKFKNLPSSFDKFKVIQISDLHVGPLIKKDYVEKVVALANKAGADVIAITGDLVDGRVDQLRDELMPLKKLKAKYGIYYVTGNHEHYWDEVSWVKFIRDELEFVVLENENRQISIEGQRITLGGVHDYMGLRTTSNNSFPDKAAEGVEENEFSLLLAHQPKSCYKAQKAGFDYMICGHTHGGQYYPIGFIVYLAQPYVKGLYDHEGMKVYVNMGTGFWGPPNRLGTCGEVTVHNLLKS
jgi:predicted MPP superfamily phosphohydrolase